MAGPYFMAKPLIEKHGVAVFSSNYNLYGDLSWRVMETLRMILGKKNIEVYSVDEAFIDLDMFPEKELEKIAKEIRTTVEDWTGIKVSVGVAPTKVLAKLANRLSKKDKQGSAGVMVLRTPEEIKDALQKMIPEYRERFNLRSSFATYRSGVELTESLGHFFWRL